MKYIIIILKSFLNNLKDLFNPVLSIFNDDAHNIVSKKGWEILNNQKNENEQL